MSTPKRTRTDTAAARTPSRQAAPKKSPAARPQRPPRPPRPPRRTPQVATKAKGFPRPPATPDELAAWLREAIGVTMVPNGLLDGSSSAWQYVLWSYFEGRPPGAQPPQPGEPAVADPPADAVVWANRGGGKTFAGAVATLLDLVFKPGIEVRVLAGSLEQAGRMHAHLVGFFSSGTSGGVALKKLLAQRITARRIVLRNGSRAQVLAASHTSVRGVRVQKVRCDEVDLFDRELWEAAQLTVRSLPIAGPWGPVVRGSVDALSTMHVPHGLMWDVVSQAGASEPSPASRRLFRWGVIDALERCPPTRDCASCALWPWCGGRAKREEAAGGHIAIDDALHARLRVSTAAWESEMLCLRPSRGSSVLPEFDARIHVFGSADVPAGLAALAELPGGAQPGHPRTERTGNGRWRGGWVAGMDFGLRSPLVWLWAHVDADGVLRIVDEHVVTDVRLEDHLGMIRARAAEMGWPEPDWVGVDPAGQARSEQTGMSAVGVLRHHGLVVRVRRLSLAAGLELVRRRLEGRGGGGGGEEGGGARGGAPRLLIHARCKRLIESIQRYRYPQDRPESIEPLKDGHDHACDAMRYLIVCLDAMGAAATGDYL